MNYLEPSFMRDFLQVVDSSGVKLKHEHIAKYSYDLQDEIDFLISRQTFVCLVKSDAGAFLERKNQGIELLCPSDTPEHIGWIVSTPDDFEALYESFIHTGQDNFTPLPKYNIDDESLKATMFEHLGGAVVQILWRKELIFSS